MRMQLAVAANDDALLGEAHSFANPRLDIPAGTRNGRWNVLVQISRSERPFLSVILEETL